MDIDQTTPPPIVTRKDVAEHTSFSLRHVDELTRKGILPHFKIGKSVRYSLAEVDEALRSRFHVRAKSKKTAHAEARN